MIISKPVKVFLIVLGILAVVHGLAFAGIYYIVSFKGHKNLSYETKQSFANEALMPELAGSIERYGVAGFVDPECQIETYKYNSLDDLCNAIPKVRELLPSAPVEQGRDIDGKKGSVSKLESIRPFNNKTSNFADLSLIDEDSMRMYYTWNYSVIVYPDGSCRFVINVLST